MSGSTPPLFPDVLITEFRVELAPERFKKCRNPGHATSVADKRLHDAVFFHLPEVEQWITGPDIEVLDLDDYDDQDLGLEPYDGSVRVWAEFAVEYEPGERGHLAIEWVAVQAEAVIAAVVREDSDDDKDPAPTFNDVPSAEFVIELAPDHFKDCRAPEHAWGVAYDRLYNEIFVEFPKIESLRIERHVEPPDGDTAGWDPYDGRVRWYGSMRSPGPERVEAVKAWLAEHAESIVAQVVAEDPVP